VVEKLLDRYSPVEVVLSSERLAGFIVAESRLSLVGLEEGGGMLILGLSIMVFVCSVPASNPFLRLEEALVADKRVRELDLMEGRDGNCSFVESELEVEETTLVSSGSSASGMSSGSS
jgi:hypothetical protein